MDRKRIGDFLMAHFAELDENNIVTNVIVVHNNELLDENGYESEQKGIDFCVAHFGGRWLQTSYNASFRFNYAGIGYTWDETLEAFIAPKCHDEAILNEATAIWDCENEAHYAVS
jgi:hypothetical protein